MLKTYRGACHCGAVRYEADIDFAQGTSKCNCSICSKGRFWKALVNSRSFRLLQGTEVLAGYRFGGMGIDHLFCIRCGIKPFGRTYLEELGGEIYAVNVACLEDGAAEEASKAPIRYEDGRNDRWNASPAEILHL